MKIIILFLSIFLSACATSTQSTLLSFAVMPPPQLISIIPKKQPSLSPFADTNYWVVVEDIIFDINKGAYSIRIPKGFITDLASTPRKIWGIYPPFGKYTMAAIIHDYLYWEQPCKKHDADKILAQTMQDANESPETISNFFKAVDTQGCRSWKQNELEKKQNFIRVLPKKNLDTLLKSKPMEWDKLKKSLQREGVKEPNIPPISSQLCEFIGNQIEIETKGQNLIIETIYDISELFSDKSCSE